MAYNNIINHSPVTRIEDVQIYDNFVAPDYLEYLKYYYIQSCKVQYDLNLSSTGDGISQYDLEDDIWDKQLVKPLIRAPFRIDEDTNTLMPFLACMPYCWRAKVNVTFPSESEPKRMGVHTDIAQMDGKYEYFSGIFYLNTNNGYTEIKNPDGELHKFESIENRFIVFPGYFKHSGYTCTNVKARFLINFVFFGNFHPDYMAEASSAQGFPWSPRNK